MSPDQMLPLTDAHVTDVCRAGKLEKTCRYLAANQDGWVCAKLIPEIAQAIEERIFAGTMRAQGDNCEGRSKYLGA